MTRKVYVDTAPTAAAPIIGTQPPEQIAPMAQTTDLQVAQAPVEQPVVHMPPDQNAQLKPAAPEMLNEPGAKKWRLGQYAISEENKGIKVELSGEGGLPVAAPVGTNTAWIGLRAGQVTEQPPFDMMIGIFQSPPELENAPVHGKEASDDGLRVRTDESTGGAVPAVESSAIEGDGGSSGEAE